MLRVVFSASTIDSSKDIKTALAASFFLSQESHEKLPICFNLSKKITLRNFKKLSKNYFHLLQEAWSFVLIFRNLFLIFFEKIETSVKGLQGCVNYPLAISV